MFVRNPDEKFTKLVNLFKELPPKYQGVGVVSQVYCKRQTQYQCRNE
ncbi:hypothetical protein AGMMS50267_14580 [Spirochaetia bacterium]|nr:hypothetical protein AGMMS50267_14580 [Spirochaetia bacterium]